MCTSLRFRIRKRPKKYFLLSARCRELHFRWKDAAFTGMTLHRLVRRNQGGKSLVSIKYQNLHPFKKRSDSLISEYHWNENITFTWLSSLYNPFNVTFFKILCTHKRFFPWVCFSIISYLAKLCLRKVMTRIAEDFTGFCFCFIFVTKFLCKKVARLESMPI